VQAGRRSLSQPRGLSLAVADKEVQAPEPRAGGLTDLDLTTPQTPPLTRWAFFRRSRVQCSAQCPSRYLETTFRLLFSEL
jgi:hypothetical protein